MNRLLVRLEQRFGRWAIPNLTLYIVAANAFTWVLETARPGFNPLLMLDLDRIREGEVWRLITFLFVAPATSPIWILFCLYFTWLIGTALEAQWGAFKFNVFYLVGTLGTLAAAWVLQESMSNFYLNTTLFLAFATIFPDFEVLIFFILPVKVKWLALLTVIGLADLFLTGTTAVRVAIGAALANYFLFFHSTIVGAVRRGFQQTRNMRRRRLFEPPPRQVRYCKTCGISDEDRQVDMRVCACEKCGKPTDYCLEHARNH